MDRVATADTDSATVQESAARTQRLFTTSMVISGIRCVLAYVIFPFVIPFLGLAPGVGPAVGVAIGVVAIVANVFSLRRFQRSQHRLRKPMMVIHVGVIGLLVVLMVTDLSQLVA